MVLDENRFETRGKSRRMLGVEVGDVCDQVDKFVEINEGIRIGVRRRGHEFIVSSLILVPNFQEFLLVIAKDRI